VLAPPFNTAIVKGYNELTGAKVNLGGWRTEPPRLADDEAPRFHGAVGNWSVR
jgi:hypothetical protein